jgi:ribose/xylose/arabinose/galactoside ABC-type transport system permease subunit
MYAARGIAFIISDGKSVNVGLPPSYDVLGRGFVGAVPLPAILLIVVFLIFLFIEKRTTLGKYCFAIGGNKTAAILSGINVNSIVIILYTIVGCLAGLAGIIMSSRLGVGQPSVGIGFEFDVIVAIVLGGTSLAGGKGSLTGMLIGALIVGFLSNGLNLLNVQSFYQEVFKGLVLVGAVILDNTIKNKLGKASSASTKKLQVNAEE